MDTKNYEHILDATSSPESEDTKGDGNNTSENTRSSGNMAMSTLDPDNMTTVDIDIGPNDIAHQVYQTEVSPVKHPRTVGLGQLHQEELQGYIEQPESTSLGDELQKKQSTAVRIAALRGWIKHEATIVHTYNSRNQLSEKFCTKQTVSAINAKGQIREAR